MSDKLKPVMLTWDREAQAFRPSNGRALMLADEQFEHGADYSMAAIDERSGNSHDHFFCATREAFDNWPEDYPHALPDEDHLRYHALIATGYYDQVVVYGETAEAANADALKIVRRVPYAEISAFETVAIVRLPRTMKKQRNGGDMDRAEWQKAKQDCLDFYAAVLGISVDQLREQAKRHFAPRRKMKAAA